MSGRCQSFLHSVMIYSSITATVDHMFDQTLMKAAINSEQIRRCVPGEDQDNLLNSHLHNSESKILIVYVLENPIQ